MLDVHIPSPHRGAQQSIIRFPEPSAHFPAYVHLDQRELLEIVRVDLVEVGGGKTDCGAIFDRADGGAAWKKVHHRHLPEAVAILEDAEKILLSAPGFQHRGFAASRTNIESAWSCSRKKNSFV